MVLNLQKLIMCETNSDKIDFEGSVSSLSSEISEIYSKFTCRSCLRKLFMILEYMKLPLKLKILKLKILVTFK